MDHTTQCPCSAAQLMKIHHLDLEHHLEEVQAKTHLIPPVLGHQGVLVQLGHKDLEHPDLQELLELVLHQLEGLVLGPLLDQWEPLELVMGHLEFQGHLEALDLLEVLEQTQGHLEVLEQTQVPLEALEVVEALV